FFQAEDGIRDRNVTGVQTCALPISKRWKVLDVEVLEPVSLPEDPQDPVLLHDLPVEAVAQQDQPIAARTFGDCPMGGIGTRLEGGQASDRGRAQDDVLRAESHQSLAGLRIASRRASVACGTQMRPLLPS